MRATPDRQVLTQKVVEKLPILKRRVHYYDTTNGFGVRVEPSGRRSFFFFAKANGKPEFRALGKFPDVHVKDARAAARGWAGKLSDWKLRNFEGPSPFEKEKKENQAAPTFSALAEAYIENQVRPEANHPERAEYQVRWMLKRHFATWLDRPMDEITVNDMLAVKNACGKRHYLANRATEFIRALYNWAGRSRDGKINFWRTENPAADVECFEENARETFLQPEQLARFNDALRDETHADLKDFLTLAITTGARRSDLFSLRWQDIQWEREVWRVPFPKNGESYDVSLLPAALEVLERRRSEIPDSEEFVFPSHGKTGHLIELKKPWNTFRRRAKITGIRVHDIRRSVASFAAIAGVSLQTIGAMLGHKSMQSTLVYARLHDEATRAGREAGQIKMIEMMASVKKRTRTRNEKLLAAANG